MDQKTCRAQLTRLLVDENALLTELEQQLRNEHAFLAGNDVEALERAGTARQNTVAKLLRLDDDRRGLFRRIGKSDDKIGLAALVTWCDPTGSLDAAQSACASLAEACREQNERNGALATARLARVTGMHDIISTN